MKLTKSVSESFRKPEYPFITFVYDNTMIKDAMYVSCDNTCLYSKF